MAKAQKATLFVGTSGWAYKDWEGIFYPKGLFSEKRLQYFSQYFKTTEVNYSFYRLPQVKTYKNWRRQTPADFVFAVKASRFITHIKRLKGVKEAWKIFIERAFFLKEKLGPILFQFPASFKASLENIRRLENFLKEVENQKKIYTQRVFLAFEFRHPTWLREKVYRILKKYNTAWVIADSSRYPKAEVITADFLYLRMHGPDSLFISGYPQKELRVLSRKVKSWLKKNLDIYIYFNNDFHGYAIENAKQLLKFCQQ